MDDDLEDALVATGPRLRALRKERETTLAFEHAEHADVFLVIGSSLVVHPAAYLPVRAVECGAKLVIVNLETTPCDRLATVVVRGKAGASMSEILGAMAA